ncbi:hypothetical protein COR50_01440 [Chitinophaga caeni]|uniref:Uncharacterized protein n=1 Tax=Chitinophaga caeni TaxID=2029983 RepID=A0A291QPK0_9BACT|nr:ABC transporter permease [Chitinophaga caeni]ATL45929.1 hypothetical protein COR50_01440 [Chitinophaga caeni]
MYKLLRVEWFKVKGYKAFWIILALFAIPFPIVFVQVVKKLDEQLSAFSTLITAYPNLWQFTAYWGSYNIILLGMLVILMITNEHTYRTMRQNIIDGWSRQQFFYAKLMPIFILALFSTVLIALTGWIAGYEVDDLLNVNKGTTYIFYSFLQSLDYLLAALFIGVYVKRAALSIAIYFMYAILGGESLVRFLLNRYIGGEVGNFLPLQVSDEMIPIPGLDKLPGKSGFSSEYNTETYLIATLIYIAIFIYLIYRKLQKSDL